MTALSISEIRFVRAPEAYRSSGLLGWATCVVGDALGVALGVRRTQDGRLTLSFPARTDGNGRLHSVTWPIDQATRDAFETAILNELRSRGVLK